MRQRRDILTRFNEKWTPEPMSGCWLWTACVNSSGYGVIGIRLKNDNMKMYAAHRLSYELFREKFDPLTQVLHRCDTPCCVNPDHLFLGNHEINMRDAARKKRFDQKGEKNGRAKIKKEDALAIRNSILSSKNLAALYGLHKSTINSIKRGKLWAL